MTTNTLRDQVRYALQDWKGSDAGQEATPEVLADQIDQMYREYMASLPARTVAGARGRKALARDAA